AGTHVEDLRSRNGIRVNQKRVLRKTLRDRDELEIGGVRLLYLDPSEVREAPLVLAEEEDVDEEPTPAPEPAPEGLADGEEGARGADGLEQENSDSAAGFGGDDSQADGQGLSESSPDDLAPDEEPEESFREDELEPSSPATGIRGRMSGLSSLVAPQNIIALGAMGFFALLALVVMLAVMFGA
ncbi:MAG TPA: FHA domain-containing protein, partial [Myxococcaceae bacterium]|nr:FHA domain-containing protein [Myxococcaceae bacterium]